MTEDRAVSDGPPPAAEAASPEELADVEMPAWYAHGRDLAGTGFWPMARRLPVLVRQALGLAWKASRRDTAAAVLAHLASGVLTARAAGGRLPRRARPGL
ncbi:MAG TPA: hypothetical protein VGJ07_03505 [Rugosimonospora sp.]